MFFLALYTKEIIMLRKKIKPQYTGGSEFVHPIDMGSCQLASIFVCISQKKQPIIGLFKKLLIE